MSQTAEYIGRLAKLHEGERSRLRRLAGRPLDATLPGFDLFTGLWWPLRAKSPATPRREPSWLVAKLYGSFPLPHVGSRDGLPLVLGFCEPRDPPDYKARKRFRTRFDALLCTPLSVLEPHLRWALGEICKALAGRAPLAQGITGIDWVQLLDDLSIWEEHRSERDVRDEWAERYLSATEQPQRRT